MAAYKAVEQPESDVETLVSDAQSAVDELASEMEDWADNMESSNLASTDKCSQVREAADTLRNVADALEAIDTSALTAPVPVGKYSIMVPRRTRQNPSRAVRAANASARLSACVSALEEAMSVANEYHEGNEMPEDEKEFVDTCETIKDEIENAASDLDGVEFPGMYG